MARQVPTDYPGAATAALARLKARTATKLAKAASKSPPKGSVRLTFAVSWNGYHELSVYLAPQGGDGRYVSHSNPFGQLLDFEPPRGRADDPNGFAAEKPAVGQMVLNELADWWEAAGGTYARPVVGTMEGEPQRAFDFKTRQWVADDIAARIAGLTAELAALARERFAALRPAAVERLTKAAAKFGPGEWALDITVFFDDDFEVMFGVSDGTKSGSGRLYPPFSQLGKFLKTDPYPEQRDRYAELGVDAKAVWHREQEAFIADVWEEVAGPARPRRGTLAYHDDGGRYDLVARRPVTDFLGRTLSAPAAGPGAS